MLRQPIVPCCSMELPCQTLLQLNSVLVSGFGIHHPTALKQKESNLSKLLIPQFEACSGGPKQQACCLARHNLLVFCLSLWGFTPSSSRTESNFQNVPPLNFLTHKDHPRIRSKEGAFGSETRL